MAFWAHVGGFVAGAAADRAVQGRRAGGAAPGTTAYLGSTVGTRRGYAPGPRPWRRYARTYLSARMPDLLAARHRRAPPPAPLDVPVAPRNPGMPLELDWVEEVRVNRSAVERRAATLRDPPHGQEGMAGRLAAARHHADGPHHARGRRHAGQGAPAVRQGAPAGARTTCWRRWARASSPSGSAAVCVYHALRRDRGARRSRARASRSRRSRPASRRASPRSSSASPRSAHRWPRARDEIDIVITRAARAHRQLAGALRRGARLPRGLRRRAHQDDPRHRRARHAAQRGAREPGLHDGRRRLHQDLDRQGERQRHAAGRPGDGARHSRLPRAHRLHGRASSRPAASARPRMRWTGWR